MNADLARLIALARQPSPWDVGNEALYRLCREHPRHTDIGAIVAKVWLIGRSYAAAIERGRRTIKDQPNDAFYVDNMAPKIRNSEIDNWLSEAREAVSTEAAQMATILKCHRSIIELFRKFSRHDNRSLASKYLHFHVPDLFFIYDSRAVEAMGLLKPVVGRASSPIGDVDYEYGKFVEKCIRLRRCIKEESDHVLSCRELDNFLLRVHFEKSAGLPWSTASKLV